MYSFKVEGCGPQEDAIWNSAFRASYKSSGPFQKSIHEKKKKTGLQEKDAHDNQSTNPIIQASENCNPES